MLPLRYNPFRLSNTALPPQLLLLVKLLTLALIGKGYVQHLPQPFLPFLPFFDLIPGLWFQIALKTAFIVSALLLFINQKIRLSCLLLGSVFLLGTLSSKTYYSNAKFFCGLIYILTALSEEKGRPWLLQLQLMIMYFGSGVNKVLDVDWRTGQYFDHWMVHVIHARSYEVLANALSHEFISKMLSWQTIIVEIIVLPVLFFFRKWQFIGVWIGIVFHSFAFWMSGLSFGVFFVAALISYLCFAPRPPVVFVYGLGNNFLSGLLKDVYRIFDADGRFFFRQEQESHDSKGISINIKNKTNWIVWLHQWRLLIIYHPITYVLLTAFFSITFLPNIFQHIATLSCLILFFPFRGSQTIKQQH